MKLDRKSLQLYAVTDRSWLNGKSLEDEVEKICRAGATFIQLREKDIIAEEFILRAKKIKAVTDKYGIPFVINDSVETAKAVDADGVHIGQSDMEARRAREILGPDKIIGISAGNLQEALQAEKNGADYIGVGAMFPTNTKTDATWVTYNEIREITSKVSIPVVAIGGINSGNILKLRGSGVDGVAVISAIFACKDVYTATRELLELSREITRI